MTEDNYRFECFVCGQAISLLADVYKDPVNIGWQDGGVRCECNHVAMERVD